MWQSGKMARSKKSVSGPKKSKWGRALTRVGARNEIVFPVYVTLAILTSLIVVILQFYDDNKSYGTEVHNAAFYRNFSPLQTTVLIVIVFLIAAGVDVVRTIFHSYFADIFGVPYPEWALAVDTVFSILNRDHVLSIIVGRAVNYGIDLQVDNKTGFRSKKAKKAKG